LFDFHVGSYFEVEEGVREEAGVVGVCVFSRGQDWDKDEQEEESKGKGVNTVVLPHTIFIPTYLYFKFRSGSI
jgi:hypothetical protein